MSSKGHDFNWVKARRECVVVLEFERLKDAVMASIREAQEAGVEVREASAHELWVGLSASPEYGVLFSLEGYNGGPRHIRVVDYAAGKADAKSFGVTLVLNDNGECRYQIDGEGEYLRWHVIRRALEPLLFPG